MHTRFHAKSAPQANQPECGDILSRHVPETQHHAARVSNVCTLCADEFLPLGWVLGNKDSCTLPITNSEQH